MRITQTALHGLLRRPLVPSPSLIRPRSLLTLAIETSCDDTSVAVLELRQHDSSGRTFAQLHFHKKITCDSSKFRGIHPIAAHESHQENLASLVAEAITHIPNSTTKRASGETLNSRQIPDFISVTRGPGMRANLFTGVDTAKGLAVAWQKPLIGVHHMQAHALTPRLESALRFRETAGTGSHDQSSEAIENIHVEPQYPFLSMLVSGGHTLLVHSAALTHHEIVASTLDIPLGDCLDKIARIVLPPAVLEEANSSMYGAVMEEFVFPRDRHDDTPDIPPKATSDSGLAASEYVDMYKTRYTYLVPDNNEQALRRNASKWGWSVNEPLTKASGGIKNKSLTMSFSGLSTGVEKIMKYERDPQTNKLTKIGRQIDRISIEERKDLAEFSMRVAFEHIASRVVLGLQQHPAETVVVAGGVASNYYLRYILASMLCARGYGDVKVVFPRPNLCCDNAAMIGWTGMEMYLEGARDRLDIRAVSKWPLSQLLSPPDDKLTGPKMI
ncbi:hypothetical protein DM02DRAFT_536434 [Periconia macrospinosa]|uniref:N(6)-L-threonylcarbamoyladenine synthase n=1 Tax=Periconia macrospinosa TaxID=97972 RepID=A0A2V1DCL4_9PLEO|nr:hypothetical protein DM02DRAFT_536434 [Periconia macrospinosa]